jgi:tetratricopeptide (TPR) repeat protein
MKTRLFGLLFLVCLAGAGCKPDDQKTESVSEEEMQKAREKMPEALRAHVDSGNAYYRAKNYQQALGHYRAAAAIDEDQVAPWFGIYMTQLALGNGAAADSALKRAQNVAPGATLIHPDENEKKK